MIAVEFKDPNSFLTAQHSRGDNVKLPANLNVLVQNACMDRGLLILTTSIYPVVRLIPALIVSEAEVDEMLGTMREAVKAVAKDVEAGVYD